jgi:hypothetical protein
MLDVQSTQRYIRMKEDTMGQNIREVGRRRARMVAASVGATSVLGAAGIAAAVYAPAAVQNVSTTSGSGSSDSGTGSSDSGSTGSGSSQQYQQQNQQFQQGLQSSQGGSAFGRSSGS